jgi:hypothetical protein
VGGKVGLGRTPTTYALEVNGAVMALGSDPAGASSGEVRIGGGWVHCNNGLKCYNGSIYLNATLGVYINGEQVLAGRQSAISAPTGGGTVDSEARTAINAIRTALQNHGLTA